MLMEALVRFSNSQNHFEGTQRERIQPIAKTMEAHGGHVLKCDQKQQKKNITRLSTACVVSSKRPELSGTSFVQKW